METIERKNPNDWKRSKLMNNRNSTVLAGVVIVLLLAGCASAPERELSREVALYATLANGHDPLNPEQLSPHFDVTTTGITKGVISHYEGERGHALNVLTISGGGQNGAFGAGFLKGWRERGTRPQFDIVTGVSTGGLLATHAFLGAPADDAVLEALYTQIDKDDIYRSKGLLALAMGGNSLLDTAPLKALIAKYMTPEVLERVAAGYDDNRRLWLGTTNIDYDQTWLWNMTLIAKQGGPDALALYRKVLLASASFPIVFPPVEIDGHLFVDGAARANIVVTGVAGTDRPKAPVYGPGNVYVIANGRAINPPHTVPNDIKNLAGTAIAVMMNSSTESLLMRAYFAARYHGYLFKMVSIPEDVDIGNNALAFDTKQMRAGFDAGRELAKLPNPWSPAPPNLGDIPTWMFDLVD